MSDTLRPARSSSRTHRKRRIPSLCLHKATGQAVVRLNGQDIYCGVHGTAQAQEKYDRVIAEWLLTGQQAAAPTAGAAPPDRSALTVNELILAYYTRHVTVYYVKKGTPTSEQDNIRQALRFVKNLYGETPAISSTTPLTSGRLTGSVTASSTRPRRAMPSPAGATGR
jgi:hypothetical protein